MILKEFLPNPAFSEFVRWYRIVHFEFDGFAQIPSKAYPPRPEESLYFIFRDGLEIEANNSGEKVSLLSSMLMGQQTSLTKRYFGKSFLNFQIIFQPGGLFRLTGMPSSELTNQFVDAEYIFSKNIRFIHEQLQLAKSYGEMLLIADEFMADLVRHVKKDSQLIDSATKMMIQRHGNISLSWLAKESCLCKKQFARKFYERTGVNPKTYARLIRFSKAFNIKNRYPKMDWLRISIECDYFDYQHLVKDYKSLTGFTPNGLHLLESNSPESMLGLADELYRSRIKLM